MKEAVLIAGPTAAGKSALALALAEEINGVIINTDSMQVYRELPVLTGQPSADEKARVPHRLYGHVSAMDAWSAGRFQRDAALALDAVRAEGRIPIFAGGTGLYFNVLTQGLSPIPEVPSAIRFAVRERLASLGRERFYADLLRRDPRAVALRPSDTNRILRAADVLEATGRPLSEWQAVAGRPVLQSRDTAAFVLAPDREVLNERIGRRFEAMIRNGAIEETRALLGLDPALPASRVLGFRELSAWLRDEIPLNEAVLRAQRETRRFAKRQLTWFRRYMTDWCWLTAGDASAVRRSIASELGRKSLDPSPD